MSSGSKDVIYLRNLQLSAVVGGDAWGRTGKAQPLIVSFRLQRDTSPAGYSDAVQDTFSYGQMSKEVTAAIDGKSFLDLDEIITSIRSLSDTWAGEKLECQVTLPKGLLRVEGGFGRDTIMQRCSSNEWRLCSSHWFVRNVKAACIIGVNQHERLVKQAISIDLRVPHRAEVLDHNWSISPPDSSLLSTDMSQLRRLVSMIFEVSGSMVYSLN